MRVSIKFACFCLVGLSNILPVQAENLFDIYQQALVKDPTYLAAEAERNANLESRPQAIALYLPQVQADGFVQDNDFSTDKSKNPFTTSDSFTSKGYNLNLSQALLNYDLISRIRASNFEVLRAEAAFQSAYQDLIVRVAESYFDVLAAQDNLEFVQAEKKAISQQLNQTKQRFNVGLTAITDVHESQARYDQSVATEILAINQLDIAKEALREITGMSYEHLALLDADAPLVKPDPLDIEVWAKTALAQNLDLIAVDKAREIAREEVARARAGHYPTLDLLAGFQYNDNYNAEFGARRTNKTVSINLNIPLYEGGLISSQVRQAIFQYQQAKDIYEQQRRATERQARSAYLSTLANISGVYALKQAVVSNETALEATQAGFDVGTRTAVDVLDSQRELYRSRSIYARARYDYIVQTLRLRRAAGILSEKEVQAITNWLH